ncbi:MAG TPA: hypothetical protein VLS53_05910 [Candidatus Dormibacteraeota bacterium]|nr:hypothetical protein [Candidatus Dormibacteraeota bacterium]
MPNENAIRVSQKAQRQPRTTAHHHQRDQAESATRVIASITMRPTRLGLSPSKMAAMVKRATVRSVVAGWTTMVLASEVKKWSNLQVPPR